MSSTAITIYTRMQDVLSASDEIRIHGTGHVRSGVVFYDVVSYDVGFYDVVSYDVGSYDVAAVRVTSPYAGAT